MKKLLVVAALVACTVSLSSAQGQGGQQRTPEERAKMSVERMKTSITSLSADQEAKLIALSLAQSKSQDSLSAAITARVTSVLTDDQKKTYSAYIAERGNRGGFGGGQRGGGAGGTMPSPEERAKMSLERLKTAASLTLSPEQESKVLTIMVDQSKAQTALAAANSAKTLAIFNDEQKKAYTTMLEQRRQGGGAPRPAGQ